MNSTCAYKSVIRVAGFVLAILQCKELSAQDKYLPAPCNLQTQVPAPTLLPKPGLIKLITTING